MSIRNNLRAGIGFLFLLALLSSGLGAYYIYRLSNDAKAILRDNYDSLIFSENIDKALDLPNLPQNIQQQIIEKNIKGELGNITEPGEKALADSLYADFIKFRLAGSDALRRAIYRAYMKTDAYGIIAVNMKAIQQRNNRANASANQAIVIVALIDSVCIIIALLFLLKFPAFITKPINELTLGIREIANKNYRKRLKFTSRNEFYELAEMFNHMAGKLYDYENSNLRKINYEKLRVETIVQNVTDAIIGFDENNTIISVNPVAVKLLGVEEGELIGQPADKIAIENDLFNKLLNEDSNGEDLKLYMDGKETFFAKERFEINTPEDGDLGKPGKNRIGQFILLKNLTRFYQLDEAKTNFIATVSHELKTPIGSLKMSLKLLETQRFGEINAAQRDLLKNIDDDSDRLLKITGELLDMGQVETGKLLLNFGATHPLNIVKYAQETIRFIAAQKNITIKISCPKKLPEVWADLDKTTWVLINLLTNALKYSEPETQVELTVKKQPSKMMEFSVKDSGRGIAENYLPRLFERYFKVPDAGSNISGTGLGLAIAKDFIEAQGGQIGVESEIDNGSRFFFLLPMA